MKVCYACDRSIWPWQGRFAVLPQSGNNVIGYVHQSCMEQRGTKIRNKTEMS